MPAVSSPVDLLTTEFHARPLAEVLQAPPTALLGVSPAAAAALEGIGIRSVFDLALSRIFGAAAQLTEAAEDPTSALSRFGAPPTEMVDPGIAGATRVQDLRFQPVGVLAGIPDDPAFADALGVRTVRDLAVYPPYRAARRILNAAFFPEAELGFDPEAPADLVPKSGEFPTERAQYTVLLLDSIRRPDGAPPLVDIASGDFQPVDLAPAAAPDFAFRTIGLGALLTLNQSWFMQGVTLGQLLHSTALAPGESTRIAVIDWSRKSRAGQTEQIAETEDLINDTAHNRSISEVTEAVAREAQSGFSSTTTESTSTQMGGGGGFSIGGFFKSLGFSAGAGGTASTATTTSSAESYSTTAGRRDVSASLLQQVSDRTHQHAHAARTRRASVVKEVSQSEHERISTRVVTNYNHMHALTVQYYEVLQLYRIETSVARADRAVFIPFQLVDFTNEDILRRFRGALAAAALSPRIADALANFDTLELAPDREARFPVLGASIKDLTANLTFLTALRRGAENGGSGSAPPADGGETPRVAPAAARAAGGPAGEAAGAVVREAGLVTATVVRRPAASINAVREQVAAVLWGEDARRLSGLLRDGALRPKSESLFVPADVKVADAAVRGASSRPLSVAIHRRGNGVVTDVDAPIPLADIERIAINGSDPNADVDATVTLTLVRNGVFFPLELPAVTVPRGRQQTRVVAVRAAGADVNLVQHLMDNRLHYSQAVFRALDGAMLTGLLSNFSITLNGQSVPVAEVVDPVPVRIVGNFLVFRIQADPQTDEEWRRFLEARGIRIGEARVDFVPLSSGGVFAEAVLGRSNSAEKLDITRFWNWQDSPIPLQPSDIAAIQAGSRAQPENVAPGSLSAPVVSIQQPTALPDPVTAAGVLAALGNGALFRDMSGLAQTVALAQEALKASSQGAGEAGRQAGANFQAALTAMTEIARAKLGAGKSAADRNPSHQGALINEQDKRKEKEAGGGAAGAGGPAENGAGAGGGAAGSGSAGTAARGGSSSSGNPALDVATFGPEGKPTDEAIRRSLGLAPDSPVPTPETTAEGVPLRDFSVHCVADRWFQSSAAAERKQLDDEKERELIARGSWRPGTEDLERLARPLGFPFGSPDFGSLVRWLSLQPAGSIRSLSIIAYAKSRTSLSFSANLTYKAHVDTGRWELDTGDSGPESLEMTMGNLARFAAGQPLPAIGDLPVALADVRKAFAPDGEITIFNLEGGLSHEFIQVIANFFQARTTAFFPSPVRVLAEEITETEGGSLVKDLTVTVGKDGDPPDTPVDRLDQLRGHPRAFTAFPRRP